MCSGVGFLRSLSPVGGLNASPWLLRLAVTPMSLNAMGPLWSTPPLPSSGGIWHHTLSLEELPSALKPCVSMVPNGITSFSQCPSWLCLHNYHHVRSQGIASSLIPSVSSFAVNREARMCTGKMAWQAEALATKPDNLSLSPGTQMVEEENRFLQVSPVLFLCACSQRIKNKSQSVSFFTQNLALPVAVRKCSALSHPKWGQVAWLRVPGAVP